MSQPTYYILKIRPEFLEEDDSPYLYCCDVNMTEGRLACINRRTNLHPVSEEAYSVEPYPTSEDMIADLMAAIRPRDYIFHGIANYHAVITGFCKDWNANVQWDDHGFRFKVIGGDQIWDDERAYDNEADPVEGREVTE